MATPANLMPDGLLARAGTSREGYDRQQRMLVRRLTTLQQLAHHPPPVGSLKTRNRNAKRSGVARAKVHVPRVLVRRKKQRKESGGGALTVDYDIASLHGFMDEMSKGSREQDHQEGMDGSGDEDEEVVNPHDPGTLLRGEDDGGDVYMEPTKGKAAAAGGKTAQARTGPTLYQAFHGNLLLVNKLTEFSTNLTVADMTTLWREQGQTRDLGTLTEEEMRKLFLACFRVTFPALYLRTGELEFLRFLDGIDLAQARKHGIIVIMIQCPPPSGYTPMSVNDFGKPLDNGPTSRLTRQVVAILQRVRPGIQCVVIVSSRPRIRISESYSLQVIARTHLRSVWGRKCGNAETPPVQTAQTKRSASPLRTCSTLPTALSEVSLRPVPLFPFFTWLSAVIDVFLECLGIQRAATFASGKCAHVAKGTIPNAGFSPVSTFHFSNLRPPVEFLKTNMAAVERPDRIESSPIFPCVHLTHPLSVRRKSLGSALLVMLAIQVARCAGRPTSAIKGPKSLKIGKDMALDKLELKAVENVYNEMILVAPLKRRFTWKEATKFLNAQECKDASQLWHRANKKREQIVRIDRGMLSCEFSRCYYPFPAYLDRVQGTHHRGARTGSAPRRVQRRVPRRSVKFALALLAPSIKVASLLAWPSTHWSSERRRTLLLLDDITLRTRFSPAVPRSMAMG